MILYQQISVLIALAVILSGHQAAGQTSARSGKAAVAKEVYTVQKCDERRLSRMQIAWNFYWARNPSTPGANAPISGGRNFDETTEVLTDYAQDLAALLKKEKSSEAKQNLKYLNKKLIPNLGNCEYFAGTSEERSEFARHFGSLKRIDVLPPAAGHIYPKQKNETPMEPQPYSAAAASPLTEIPSQPLARERVMPVVIITTEETTNTAR